MAALCLCTSFSTCSGEGLSRGCTRYTDLCPATAGSISEVSVSTTHSIMGRLAEIIKNDRLSMYCIWVSLHLLTCSPGLFADSPGHGYGSCRRCLHQCLHREYSFPSRERKHHRTRGRRGLPL